MSKQILLTGVILIIAAVAALQYLPSHPAEKQDTLQRFSSYDEMKSFFNESMQQIAYRQSATSGTALTTAETNAKDMAVAPQASGSADHSNTNIQVAGVDEADIIKNDGKYIYAVSGSNVLVIDAYPAENSRIVSQISFNTTPTELFVNGDRMVVFGQEYSYNAYKTGAAGKIAADIAMPYPYYYSSPVSYIRIYDITDRANPVLLENLSTEGNYVTSRMIGDYVYDIVNEPVYNYNGNIPVPLVSSNGVAQESFPGNIYYFDALDSSYNFVNIIAVNTQTGEMTNKVYTMPYAGSIFVSQNNIYLTYMKYMDYTEITDRIIDEVILPVVPTDLAGKINAARTGENKWEIFSNVEKILYNYTESLNPESLTVFEKALQERYDSFNAEIAKERQKTIIQKIFINNGDIQYKTKGSVPGSVLNQFSMDENNGYFRIATTLNNNGFGFMPVRTMSSGIATTQTVIASSSVEGTAPASSSSGVASSEAVIAPPAPSRSESVNNLYVLDQDMNVVGQIEDLAPGERIYSTRFAGDRAYMVTFRQVDPLFVIDLKNPSAPSVLGFLKVTGVSDYLQPVDENHIIGIGHDATENGRLNGLKMSLFDVTDVSNPKEISKILIGDRGTSSEALYDHKAVLFDKDKGLLVLPVLLAEINQSEPVNQWTYGQYTFQGAYVFSFSPESGFSLRGKITHAQNTTQGYQNYWGQYAVKRNLYIGNVLYTISGKLLKMNDLQSLNDINSISLPGYEERMDPYLEV